MEDGSIIIGLGGIGSDICAMVAERISSETGERQQIYPVVIDTDQNALNDLKRNGFWGELIQISDDVSVNHCTEKYREQIESWFPFNSCFEKKSMAEGAGQMRAISRLAFHAAVQTKKLESLERIIKEIRQTAPEAQNKNIRIYIISSLAGGTGSGVFLPLSMYLQQLILEIFGDYKFNCKGFLLLASAIQKLVSTSLEKQSLNANSYAAVKELSAFWAKEDNYFEGSNKISMELPVAGEKRTTVSESSGYECCYLFGEMNREQRFKGSVEEIKKTVANAVYMQVCSPIRSVNHSREDNSPLFLAKQMGSRKGRMCYRFGAIGCGALIYPYEQLIRFYAMKWAGDVMSRQWKKYDEAYYREIQAYFKLKRMGKRPEETRRSDSYIRAIEHDISSDVLAKEIKRQVDRDGKPVWKCYLEELHEAVVNESESLKKRLTEEVSGGGDCFERTLEKIKNRSESVVKRRKELDQMWASYGQMREFTKRYVKRDGEAIAKRIVSMEKGDESLSHKLCNWLVQEGEWIHPNGIRYVLYKLLNEAELKMRELEEKKAEAAQGIEAEANKKKPWLGFSRKWKNETERGEAAERDLYEYFCASVEALCIEQVLENVKQLSLAYENFYDNFSHILQKFSDEAEDIAYELDRKRGQSNFYVCADEVCRNKVQEMLSSLRGYQIAGSELSSYLFWMLQEPSKGERTENTVEKLREHWIENTKEKFDRELNLNILDAIEEEGRYKNNRELQEEDLRNLIQDRREELEAPLSFYLTRNEVKEISFCCFNSQLEQCKGKQKAVVQWMKRNEGIGDSQYCTPYELIFYCSVIGIGAHNIPEFGHKQAGGLTGDGNAWIHYKNAVEVLEKYETEKNEKTPQLTPHIDKRWHIDSELPDVLGIDEHSEEEYGENDTDKAQQSEGEA